MKKHHDIIRKKEIGGVNRINICIGIKENKK